MKLRIYWRKVVVGVLFISSCFHITSVGAAAGIGTDLVEQLTECRATLNAMIIAQSHAAAEQPAFIFESPMRFFNSLQNIVEIESGLYTEVSGKIIGELNSIDWDVQRLQFDGDRVVALSVRTEEVFAHLDRDDDVVTMVELHNIKDRFKALGSVIDEHFRGGFLGMVRSVYEANAPWVFHPRDYPQARMQIRSLCTLIRESIVPVLLRDPGFFSLMVEFRDQAEVRRKIQSLGEVARNRALDELRELQDKAEAALNFAQAIAGLGCFVCEQEPLSYLRGVAPGLSQGYSLIRNYFTGAYLQESVAPRLAAPAWEAIHDAIQESLSGRLLIEAEVPARGRFSRHLFDEAVRTLGSERIAEIMTDAGFVARTASDLALSQYATLMFCGCTTIFDWFRKYKINAKTIHLQEQLMCMRLVITGLNVGISYCDRYTRKLRGLLARAGDTMVRRDRERQSRVLRQQRNRVTDLRRQLAELQQESRVKDCHFRGLRSLAVERGFRLDQQAQRLQHFEDQSRDVLARFAHRQEALEHGMAMRDRILYMMSERMNLLGLDGGLEGPPPPYLEIAVAPHENSDGTSSDGSFEIVTDAGIEGAPLSRPGVVYPIFSVSDYSDELTS